MEEKIPDIEILGSNFRKMDEKMFFMKEQFSKFEKSEKLNINFKKCHVAISPNGGYIAICKKKNFEDEDEYSKLHDYILVMHQDGKTKYYIPIDWNYENRWLIAFDYNEKEQLYGICNDGSIIKFDIINLKAIKKTTIEYFQNDNIVKAKFYENGFMALTEKGIFYLIKNIKNPELIKFFPMNELLGFSNNIDFLIIPDSSSKSKNIELLINNEKGQGVIHIEQNNKDSNNKISIIINDKIEQYMPDKRIEENPNNLGKIEAMAISPSNTQIALYNSEGAVFFFHSTIDQDLSKFPRMKVKYEINKQSSEKELKEQEDTLHYKDGYQFLFCGEDAICLVGQMYILLINTFEKTIDYKINEIEDLNAPPEDFYFCKCLSEIDGLRFLTNKGVFFVKKVPNELYEICFPTNITPSKKLLNAYNSALTKQGNSEMEIREISSVLSSAINNLQIAAANIYWLDKDIFKEKKNIQLYILNAAQFGKSFIGKDDFDFDKFVETCKDIRIINNLRNHNTKCRLITFNEYKKMNPKDLIKKLLKQQNYSLASEISNYLDYNNKRVYQSYAISNIKRLPPNCKVSQQEKLYNELISKFQGVQNISYIKIAKKAFKYEKYEIGLKFLDNEKSILIKIPQYIKLKKWDKALELALETFDNNILNAVLDKILKNESVTVFISIVSKYSKAKSAVTEFLSKKAPDQLEYYLKELKNNEAMIFYYLELFFNSNSVEEKKKYVKLAKDCEKNMDSTFDHKFYRNYLECLEKSISFKNDCISPNNEANAQENNSNSNFDDSIYDCYKLGILNGKESMIESQNKKNFDLADKKLTLLKFRTYAEKGKFDDIENLITKLTLKKLGLTPVNIAEIYLEYNKYDKAVEYIKQIIDNDYFDYKVDMLKYMEKYEDALEVIISDKNKDAEKMKFLVDEIVTKRPDLKKKVEDLCLQYKVNLS